MSRDHRRVAPQPPDDAYGRVTDPERYGVLHEAGDRLETDLAERFEVERREGHDVDRELAADAGPCLRVVRLEPRNRAAAPITMAWTAFPGLLVRIGRWHVEGFPRCGCDACEEGPAELVAALGDLVDGVVQGGLTEWFDGRRVGYELSQQRGRRSGEGRFARWWQPRAGTPERHRWEPWPVRMP
jgi:Family of unknown function (DUF6226)